MARLAGLERKSDRTDEHALVRPIASSYYYAAFGVSLQPDASCMLPSAREIKSAGSAPSCGYQALPIQGATGARPAMRPISCSQVVSASPNLLLTMLTCAPVCGSITANVCSSYFVTISTLRTDFFMSAAASRIDSSALIVPYARLT